MELDTKEESMKVGTGVAEISADDSMVIAGGILPRFASGQEGKLRASAIIIEEKIKLCLVSCDVLMVKRDILDEVSKNIEKKFGIPFDNILICSTHTHHAPSTCRLHGYERDENFCKNLKDSILSYVVNLFPHFRHSLLLLEIEPLSRLSVTLVSSALQYGHCILFFCSEYKI